MKRNLLVLLILTGLTNAQAASYFWVGPLVSGNWSDAANWSATSGGMGNAGVPGSGDNATINTNANIKTGAVSMSALTVNANAGLVPQSSTINFNVSSLTIGSSNTFTLNAGGTGITLTITGSCSNNGILDLSTGGGIADLTTRSSLNSGTFKRSDPSTTRSKIRFEGSSTQSMGCDFDSGSKIDVIATNAFGANTVNMTGTVYIPGDLTLSGTKVVVGANALTVKGKIVGNGAMGNYVVLNDPSGSISVESIGDNRELMVSPFFIEGGKNFFIGASTTSFDPLYIYNDEGVDVKKTFTVKLANRVPTGAANSTKVFRREWDISTSSVSAVVEFKPDASSAPSVGFTPTPPVIGHYVGSVWTEKASTPDLNLGGGLPYGAKFTSFSPFGVGQASGFLPVELISFKATQTNKSNLLTWQTASEKNNNRFEVERSATGQEDWVKVGTVKGNGNSQIIQNYSFSDETPLSLGYYRLKQVDNDGSFEYSNVVSVTRKGGKLEINAVSPNPTKDNLSIQFESSKSETVVISFTDVMGRVVLTQNAATTEGVNILNVNTTALSNGIYILSMKNSESVLTQKVIKQF